MFVIRWLGFVIGGILLLVILGIGFEGEMMVWGGCGLRYWWFVKGFYCWFFLKDRGCGWLLIDWFG